MITVQPENKVFRSANFQESKFSIQASAKAFNILSSGLYSDKFSAIVRELCTNASDAHVMAGKASVPIKVTCPSSFNSTFIVEDFGNGIDPSEFENIYTTYFYSTKTNTNDQVGCFGLGSKSPFAYTDQFTVENCYAGNKYTYSCYKTKDGQPAVALLSTVPTDKSGIKVFFAVRHGDSYAFENAIRKILCWFDVKPDCNVHIETTAKPDKVFSLPCSSQYGIYQGGCYVRMGQVLYPVPSNHFSNIFKSYRGRTTVINIEVGDVDITPSRESVELTARTESTLEKLRDEVRKYLTKEIKDIENNTDLSAFEKYKAKYNYITDNDLDGNFVQVSATYCYLDRNDTPYDCYKKYSYRSSVHTVSWQTQVRSDDFFVINDIKRGLKVRLSEYLNNNTKFSTAYVFHIDVKDAMMKKYDLEESDLVYASSMTAPPTVATTRNKTNCTRIYGNNYNWDKRGFYLDKTVTDGVYLRDNDWYLINVGQLRLFPELKNEGVMVFTEYQMKILKIEKRNFVHLYDFLRDKVSGLSDAHHYAMYAESDDYRKELINNLFQIADKTSDKTNLLHELKEKFDYEAVDQAELSLLTIAENMMRQLDGEKAEEDLKNSETKQGAAREEFKTVLEKINKKYPLLNNLLVKCELSDIIEGVVDYVDMIDMKGNN